MLKIKFSFIVLCTLFMLSFMLASVMENPTYSHFPLIWKVIVVMGEIFLLKCKYQQSCLDIKCRCRIMVAVLTGKVQGWWERTGVMVWVFDDPRYFPIDECLDLLLVCIWAICSPCAFMSLHSWCHGRPDAMVQWGLITDSPNVLLQFVPDSVQNYIYCTCNWGHNLPSLL